MHTSAAVMELPYASDPPRLREWLLSRLAEIPDITWDRSIDPVHSSYDDWNVWGCQRLTPPTSNSSADLKQITSGSSFSSSSSPLPSPSLPAVLLPRSNPSSRPPLSRLNSSDSKNRDRDPPQRRVIARISTDALRLDRQFQVKKLISAIDTAGDHHVRALQLFRLPPREGHQEPPLTVILLEYPGKINSLRHLVNFGPNWYSWKCIPSVKSFDPTITSCGGYKTGQFTLPTFFKFAIGATDCCQLIHQQSIIHGEIRPDAFWFDEDEGHTKWVNHGNGVRSFENGLTSAGWSSLSKQYGIEHALQFIAPEQTGRLESKPDARTDIYSLGIVFWIMLVGEDNLPFPGSSAMEVLQNVLSRRVPPVKTKRIDIPDPLSAVITKMVQRNMDNRYHSALGLKYDLQQIERMLREGETEALEKFQPAQEDQNCVFRLGTAQIGRDKERAIILDVMSKVSERQKRFRQTGGMRKVTDSDASNHESQNLLPRSEILSDSASFRSKSSSSGSIVRNGSTRTQGSRSRNGSIDVGADLYHKSSANDNDLGLVTSLSRTLSNDQYATEETSSSIDFVLRPSPFHTSNVNNQSLKRAQKFKREGRTEVVIISGGEGAGKSSLVQSILPAARSRGYFASSKFGPIKAPFEPMLQVLGSLFRQIFMESDTDSEFHADLKSFVKPVWSQLHQLLGIPANLLDFDNDKNHFSGQNGQECNTFGTNPGPSPKRQEFKSSDFLRTGATYRRSRSLAIFLDVLRFLCLRKLIVFSLDDLQAADDESIELLLQIAKARVSIVLLLTCRTTSDLSTRARTLLHGGFAHVKVMKLAPLTESDVTELLVNALHRTPDYLFGLVAVTLEKTGGNPLTVREFLEGCYKKNLIYYSWTDRLWKFDLDKILHVYASPTTNDFIQNRIRELPLSCQVFLSWAALLGNPFRFSLVKSVILDGTTTSLSHGKQQTSASSNKRKADLVRQSSQDVVRALESALAAWIIMPTDEVDTFLFCHQRYQDAVKQNLRENNMKFEEMHFRILEVLRNGETPESTLFKQAAHLLECAEIAKTRISTRWSLRDLLSTAARQSIESGGRSSAMQYLDCALRLLQDDPWNDDKPDTSYDETLCLYIRAAECYASQGHKKRALQLLDNTIEHSRNAFDKVPSQILKSRIITSQGDHETTYHILQEALASLGLPISEMSDKACDERFEALATKLESMSSEEIVNLPYNDDPTLSAITELLAEILAAAFNSILALRYYQISIVYIELTLEKGITSHAALSFMHIAACAIRRHNRISLGLKLGRIAGRLFEIFENDNYTLGRGLGINCMTSCWLETHWGQLIPLIDKAVDKSMAADDTGFVLLNAGFGAAVRLWSSVDVTDVENYCSYAPEEISDWQNDIRGGLFLTCIRQYCRAMEGKTYTDSPSTVLCDQTHDTEAYLEWASRHSSNPERVKASYFSFSLPALYLYGYHQDAISVGEYLVAPKNQSWSARANISNAFYLSLAYLSAIRDSMIQNPEEKLAYAESQLKVLEQWAEVNNVNTAAWRYILAAEISEAKGEVRDSLTYFESALDHAEVHNFTFEHGLAAELYAEFLIRRKANRLARHSMKDSIAAYRRISYFGKARHVLDKHEWLLTGTGSLSTADAGCQTDISPVLNPAHEAYLHSNEHYDMVNEQVERFRDEPLQSNAVGVDGSSTVEPLGLDMLDITGILRSTQILSSELQLDRLLSKMTKIVMESTGAEHVAIIIEDNEIGWNVAAISDGSSKDYPSGEPLDSVEDVVGKKITLYSLRFRETVLLPNVLEDERFSDVPEAYRKRNPNGIAVCAMPIIHRERVTGCVYLEGPPNSFSQRSVSVLQLLLSSVGISITNANLFKEVERVSASHSSMVTLQKKALSQARESEKKAKEAQQEALENLRLKEEAAKAKSMFLANTSHELRTPLNGVIGSSSLLKSSNLSSEQSEWVESIHVCADTLLQVINDILDFSKLEAGKMQLFSIPLNLSETIAEVVRALSYGNMGKDVQTVMELGFDEKLVVNGDPVRLHQILMNLLSNSYKFTPRGSVTIRAIVEEESEKDITVTCSVGDTGIGISESQKEKLFMPFSQADNTTSRSYGGTGLGLSICKSIIENAMGGTIWLESELNVGTTVFFTLTFPKTTKGTPLHPDSAANKGADPMAVFTPPETSDKSLQMMLDFTTIPRNQIRICVAEDNPINQKVAISYVKKLGFQCEAFADGQKAVEALEKAAASSQPFSVVLMDCQMPNLDGYAATRQIRQSTDPAIRDVLVIAMTASAIRGDREKCLEAGMNNYLAKPVRQEALKQMLDSYLQPESGDDIATVNGN